MARCKGATRSGERCRREVGGDSEYCYLHRDQAGGAPRGAWSRGEWSDEGPGPSEEGLESGMDDALAVALGLGLLALVLLLPISLLRRRC